MTKKEAKELTLEVWKYLYRHPEINYKQNLPKNLFNKIEDFKDECPLCTLFKDLGTRGDLNDPQCLGCPLDISNCFKVGSYFEIWETTNDPKIRAEAAKSIFAATKKWNTDK